MTGGQGMASCVPLLVVDPHLREWLTGWVERHPPGVNTRTLDTRDAAANPSTEASAMVSDARLEVHEVEVLSDGEVAVVSVVASIDGRLAHAVLGLRPPSDPAHPVGGGDEPLLASLNGVKESVLVFDALADADLSRLTLRVVTGQTGPPQGVVGLGESSPAVEVIFDERCALTTFAWPYAGEHPGVALLMGLDDAGFNHLPAPVARWQRGGRDLGVVQETVKGAAGGWVVALASLRDLYVSGKRPEEAGGDFAPEAESLGVMTARMHLALAKAFGQQLDEHREAGVDTRAAEPIPVLRTHGDFHLGRMARSDHGWVVRYCSPGGCRPGTDQLVLRSPLGDVSDMLWSFGRVAEEATASFDPKGTAGSEGQGRAWAERNRRAFLRAYRGTAGIDELLPQDPGVADRLIDRYQQERGPR